MHFHESIAFERCYWCERACKWKRAKGRRRVDSSSESNIIKNFQLTGFWSNTLQRAKLHFVSSVISIPCAKCVPWEGGAGEEKEKHYHEFKHICKTFYNFPPAPAPTTFFHHLQLCWHFVTWCFRLFSSPCYYCQFFSWSIFRFVYLCGSSYVCLVGAFFLLISTRQIWNKFNALSQESRFIFLSHQGNV